MREIVIICVYFFTFSRYFFIPCAPVELAPFERFLCFMAQKTYFRDSYVPFGVQTKNFIFSIIFCKKRLILYSRNVKLIGSNSGSIKDRTVKFAYSRGFSAVVDRIV